MGANRYGNITQNELQTALDTNVGDGITEVIDNGDTLVVKFIESERYYEVDSNGNVSEYEVIVDENPGNITVGINGETLSGTEDSPYEIWCIEDLVEWSNNYATYSSAYINLCITLNFESSLSYADSTRTDYGDLNGDGEIEDILTELTKTDDGCIGFTPIANFGGTFDGQGYKISNIYENNSGCIGLIAYYYTGEGVIKNIGITGYMETSTDSYAGGLVSYAIHTASSSFYNCYSNVTIVADNASMIGGLIGRGGSNSIENCSNTGEISASNGKAGGIIGYGGSVEINNCYNTGNISGANAGGIIGYSYYGSPTLIINSYNTGTITASSDAGGILGTQNGVNALVYIKNSYNIGNVVGKYVGGIFNSGICIPTIENCYNIGTLSGNSREGGIVGNATSAYNYIINGKILNSFYLNTTSSGYDYEMVTRETTCLSKSEMYSQDLVDKLNTYITDNGYEDEFNYWILGEDGYPTFE